MKGKIQFSVLMSVYYKEKANNLKEAIESIVNQTLLPDEFLIVEDGPLTEELYKVLNEYISKYKWIKTLKLDKNVGLGNALKEGVINCKYEYIARMDSDDISIKERFEKQIKYLEDNPNIDVIGTNINEYDEKMLYKTGNKVVPQNDIEIKKYLKIRNPFNHMSVIYKKERVLEAGNYIDCPYFEDYYLWCRMAKNNCMFYNVQENLLNVRAGNYMITKRGGKNYNKCILNFQKEIKKLGIINEFEYIKNIIIRLIVSSCPKKIRMIFYKKKLRRNNF